MKHTLTILALLLTATLSNAQNAQSFSFQGNVFQTYIVPTSGWYLFDIKGAQGGPAGSHIGGKGARMQAYAQLQHGDTLRIAIGGAGNSGSNDGNNVSGGGGGGSTSIIKVINSTEVLLIIAGGGGGAGSGHDGLSGLSGLSGGTGAGTAGTPGSGGTNGGGGGGGSDYRSGAGGAGYYGDGGSHYDRNNNLLSYGGQAYVAGNYGGNSGTIGGDGGWGGGGEGGPAINNFLNNEDGGGGGGGGYSGGGGGTDGRGSSTTGTGGSFGGGGGGSYVSSVLNTTDCIALDGENNGNGSVSIELLNYAYVQPVDTGFIFQGKVFQYFIAPSTGYYLVSARGGQGGDVNGFTGGRGAHLQGVVLLRAGEPLQIAVGGAGRDGEYGILSSYNDNNSLGCYSGTNRAYWTGGGGGGSSSIVSLQDGDFNPLLIAAGGGGAANNSPGNPGSCTQSGTTSADPYYSFYVPTTANWGSNGNGGSGSDAAGGGGYYSDGVPSNNIIPNDYCIESAFGQGYLSGNYGGYAITSVNQVVVEGGWGGGASGAFFNMVSNVTFDGSGGGGGGYNGGGGGSHYYDSNQGPSSATAYGGGGGGSYTAAACGSADSSGVNTGNGSVRISGPHVNIDTVNTPGPTYTWAANGVTYQHSGTYYHVDPAHCRVQVLDLSIGGLGGCLNYNRIDTTILSCGGYTNPLNGRIYTENTTDSIRVGCTKYVARIIVGPPRTALALPMLMLKVCNTSSLMVSSNAHDHATRDLAECRNTTDTFTVTEVPYATSYRWSLPAGASGTSTTNRIVVSFGNQFNGGTIAVTPVNACGSGDTVSMNVELISRPPTGRLQITGPSAPFISGNYSVAPIAGATAYTWSVSNSQAVIVSGQGTPDIQLQALPGFTRANLIVVASNCKGNGARATLTLNSNGGNTRGNFRPKMSRSDDFSVFPNPSNGQFTMNTPSLGIDATVEVYSTDGRLIHTQIIPANTTETPIELQHAAAGLYQVRVVAGEEVRNIKIVVN